MEARLDEALAVLRHDPAGTALLFDFDGTLAPIVEDPAAAEPLEGVPELLATLASAYGVVAVISGRPASHLQAKLLPGPLLVGVYGLERVVKGRVVSDAAVEAWRPLIAEAVLRADAELPVGVIVEDKGLSLTLHVRSHPELQPDITAWAEAAIPRWGLEARAAKMSVELHPPIAIDKGTVVSELVAGRAQACFVGDDVGDLPAFYALDKHVSSGARVLRIVVDSAETDPLLRARADLVLAGPHEVLELLKALLG